MPSQLKLWRIERDYTQQKFAAISGIAQQRISELERGLRPRDDELVKLSRAGVPVAQFFIDSCPATETRQTQRGRKTRAA